MSSEKCLNQNHSKMNVSVRFCPSCGETVNSGIARKKCNRDSHVKSQKSGSRFCVDCGADFKALS